MTWLHVINNTGFPLVIYGAGRIVVQPGRWCFSRGPDPHCQPKGKP